MRELAIQALSSVEGGYDLLAPKFDHTPVRTPDGVLDATAGALRPLGPFGRGLDVCCGTGAGMRVLRLDHPGNPRGRETWEDAGSWWHSGSIRRSCVNAR